MLIGVVQRPSPSSIFDRKDCSAYMESMIYCPAGFSSMRASRLSSWVRSTSYPFPRISSTSSVVSPSSVRILNRITWKAEFLFGLKWIPGASFQEVSVLIRSPGEMQSKSDAPDGSEVDAAGVVHALDTEREIGLALQDVDL